MRSASRFDVSTSVASISLAPGTMGIPACSISCRAATLSPIARIAEAGGPMKVSPAASHAPAKSGFSDRKP